MDRRIFGVETEYGVTCSFGGRPGLSPEEVTRYLFRGVVSWGRRNSVFLRNGARLYLNGASHPEYATPECDSVVDLVTHDKAGEQILEGLAVDADRRLREEGTPGDIYLFKNNTDSAGNSYGCHENYLADRHGDAGRLADILTPFLVTRQLICGAGKVLPTPRGVVYCVSQRADHIWEVPGRQPVPAGHRHRCHAARRRRAVPPPARHRGRLEHEPDHDVAQGRGYRPGAADDRGREPGHHRPGDRLGDQVPADRAVPGRHGLPLSAPRIARLDLAYHDLRRDRGLYYLLQRDGAADRVTRDLDIFAAKAIPPQTTRAKLRGEFIRRAQEKRQDITVDWVHLKLNDPSQRTVLCKDPFRSADERVDRLMASMVDPLIVRM